MSRVIKFGCLMSMYVLSSATAQELPKFPAPQSEHALLKQFVGEWETKSEGTAGPHQPPMTCEGTIDGRMLGEFWVLCEFQADMMGTPINAMLTLGYDPKSKSYVGTWVDSMMNHMWTYDGFVDDSGKVLTLEAEGPNFMAEGQQTKFRDVYEFKSANEMAIASRMLAEDGEWVTFMSGTAKRKEK